MDIGALPIVGQPHQVLMWYPTSVIVCLCKHPSQTLIVITGFGSPAACPQCGKLYVNTGVQPVPGGVAIQVHVVTPIKPAEV